MEIASVNMGELPNGKIGLNIRINKDGQQFAKILTIVDSYEDATGLVNQARVDPTVINGYKELNNVV